MATVAGGYAAEETAGDLRSGLIDLNGLSLSDLASLDRTVLADALSLLLDADQGDEPVAGFTSSI